MALKDFLLTLRHATVGTGTYRPSPTNIENSTVAAKDLGLLAGAQVAQVQGTSLSLLDEHHGLIIDFLSGSAVTVTVPAGLRDDFFCGISQGGAGQVTVSAGAGVSIYEQNSLTKTAQRYAMISLISFHANEYRLFGSTG